MGSSEGQSEEHCRGEKMSGDTRGEIRKDEDIKTDRIYKMRMKEIGEKIESMWSVVELRLVYCMTKITVSSLYPQSSSKTIIHSIHSLS